MGKELDKKIQRVFDEFAIDRGLVQRLGVSGDDRSIPNYVMDWIITRESKKADGTTDLSKSVAKFISNHLPSKGEKELVKHRLGKGEMIILDDTTNKAPPGQTECNNCKVLEEKLLLKDEIIDSLRNENDLLKQFNNNLQKKATATDKAQKDNRKSA